MRGWRRESGYITHLVVCLSVIFLTTAAYANQAPVVDNFTGTPTNVAPGGTVTLNVSAHDPDCSGTCTSGCGQYIRPDLTAWISADGPFSNINNGVAGSPYIASAQWQAPVTEGSYTITVEIGDSGGSFCGGRLYTKADVTILVTTSTNQPPVIDSLTAEKTQLLIGDSTNVTCMASDSDGDPVTYSWTTDKGSIAPGTPGMAVFTAANSPSVATVTCKATDDKGAFTSDTVAISVTGALPEKIIHGGLAAPQDLSMDSYGYMFVADQRSGGVIVVKPTTGEPLYRIPVSDITSVAVDWSDRLLIGTRTGARVTNRYGVVQEFLNSAGPLGRVQDVAVDPALQRYAVLYGGPGRVVVFNSDGTDILSFGSNGDGPGQFRGAVSLAINAGGEFVVGDTGHGLIHVFDSDGNFIRSFGGRGSDLDQFVQLQGVAVNSAGIIYAVDSFNSQVKAFQPDGTVQEVFGEYGANLGQFITPSGVAVMNDHAKLVVTSLNASSLQVFSMQGSSEPSDNTAPSVPAPIQPANGAVLPLGSTILLEVMNSFDPDFQLLQYTFELYRNDAGTLSLVRSWIMPEGPGTTVVDATEAASVAGDYEWRVQVSDGVAVSGWTPQQSFAVQAIAQNYPPSAPNALCPSAGFEVADLTPTLNAANASDPDGDTVTYTFQVALLINGVYQTVATSPQVQEGTGFTYWKVPGGALQASQQIYWRVRASDGFVDGPWSGYGDFWTPPIPMPDQNAYGNVPSGDQTRPAEVRYSLEPRSVDTTISFQVFDITFGTELKLIVNGLYTYPIPAQASGSWSQTLSISIPANQLDAVNPNRFRFIHTGLLDYWGVQKMNVDPAPVKQPKSKPQKNKQNQTPSIPIHSSPIGGVEVADLVPVLEVNNAVDPNGDHLTYIFEIALLVNGCYQTVRVSPPIAEQLNRTAWQVPAGAIGFSQQVFWRALATDGSLFSDWTTYETFRTPPIPIPSSEAYGLIPGGDQTRGAEVRYSLEPRSADTILYFRVYDADSDGELVLEVNGTYAYPITAQIPDGWSTILSITIPADQLDSQNTNLIRFIHQGLLETWGVQGVSLTPDGVTGGNP